MATEPVTATTSPALTDATLVQRLAAGEVSSVTTLYDAHATSLFSLAQHIVDDQRDAEDVVEKAFRQARTEANRFDPTRGSVGSWLLLITRRLAVEHVRSRGGGQEADAATVQLPDPARRQQFKVQTTDEADHLRNALVSLPRLQCIVVELAYFEGLSPSQIAERLEHPVEVIRDKVRLALHALRASLEARG